MLVIAWEPQFQLEKPNRDRNVNSLLFSLHGPDSNLIPCMHNLFFLQTDRALCSLSLVFSLWAASIQNILRHVDPGMWQVNSWASYKYGSNFLAEFWDVFKGHKSFWGRFSLQFWFCYSDKITAPGFLIHCKINPTFWLGFVGCTFGWFSPKTTKASEIPLLFLSFENLPKFSILIRLFLEIKLSLTFWYSLLNLELNIPVQNSTMLFSLAN